MKKNILAVVLVLIIAVLGFRAYKSYVDMNKMVRNQMAMVQVINDQGQIISQIRDMIVTEFPTQVKDYTSKLPKK